jgi:hypothetical protein
LQSVTNYSRDWSVVKFNLHLEPAADIETVRKTIKRVGEELLDDPEIAGEFMQPLKMQGVVDVLQTALADAHDPVWASRLGQVRVLHGSTPFLDEGYGAFASRRPSPRPVRDPAYPQNSLSFYAPSAMRWQP